MATPSLPLSGRSETASWEKYLNLAVSYEVDELAFFLFLDYFGTRLVPLFYDVLAQFVEEDLGEALEDLNFSEEFHELSPPFLHGRLEVLEK